MLLVVVLIVKMTNWVPFKFSSGSFPPLHGPSHTTTTRVEIYEPVSNFNLSERRSLPPPPPLVSPTMMWWWGYNKYKISQSSWDANWKLWLLVGKLEKDSIFTLSTFETILIVSKGVFIVQMLRGSYSNESIDNRCHYCSSSASLSLSRWMYRTLVRTLNNTRIIVSM